MRLATEEGEQPSARYQRLKNDISQWYTEMREEYGLTEEEIKLIDMEEGINLDYFVERTEGYNGADIDYFCEKAKEFALKRIIDQKDSNEFITRQDLMSAIASVKSSVLAVDRQEMEDWVKENNL